uniref:Fatty acyl-CoA reductase C-terminal domain-containing protein n=1 Tax=Pristionchus pacificus TaxID=54126 RepID=A0A8R1YPL3_PRIPA
MYTGALPRVPMLSHNPKSILDCVPVDAVVSMMIVCAGYRMNLHTEEAPVFHCCTSELSPFSLQKQLTIAHKYAMEYPTEKFLSSPSFNLGGFQCVESLRHKMRVGCMRPVLDKLTTLFRQQPFWTRLYRKVGYAYTALLPFTRHYQFESTGMLKLIGMMNEEDRNTFDFDVRKINWTEFSCNGMMGMKIFLMKDDDEGAIRRTKIRLISHQLISLLPVFVIFYMISVLVSRSFTAWQIFLPLMIIAIMFSLKSWCTCTKIKPLEEYREEIEMIMGEPIKSKKDKTPMA